MTKWDEWAKLRKAQKVEFEEIDEAHKVIDDKEKKDQLLDDCLTWQLEMYKKPVEQRKHYTDEYGFDIVVLVIYPYAKYTASSTSWMDLKPVSRPTKNYPDEYQIATEYSLMKEEGKFAPTCNLKASKSFFYTKEGKRKGIYGYEGVFRGKMYVTKQPLEDEGKKNSSHIDDKSFLARMNVLNDNKYESVADIPFSSYKTFYTFRRFQTLGVRKLEE